MAWKQQEGKGEEGQVRLREGGGGSEKRKHEGRKRSKLRVQSKRSFHWKNQENKSPGFSLAKKKKKK